MNEEKETVVIFSDIVEGNGKTIKENNLAIDHNIPVGSLVEVKYDEWTGNGACIKVHARLWVIKHTRDCDGTPLYLLCKSPLHKMDTSKEFVMHRGVREDGSDWLIKNDISVKIIYGAVNGLIEESLTVIEITEDLKRGKDSLNWE